MLFPYTIDVPNRVAIIRKVGRVDALRLRRTIEALFNDPDWQPGFDTIWDDSETTELLLEREEASPEVRARVRRSWVVEWPSQAEGKRSGAQWAPIIKLYRIV